MIHSTIINCVFRNNAAFSGGAIYNDNSRPLITHNTFDDNFAQRDGGAIATGTKASILSHNIFRNNTAEFIPGPVGGATAVAQGGAIILAPLEDYRIDSCTAGQF